MQCVDLIMKKAGILLCLSMFAVGIVVAACVPVPMHSTFYKPHSVHGTPTSGVCGGRVGPYDQMMYSYGQLNIRVWAYRESENSPLLTLIVKLDLPSDKRVEIGSKFVDVTIGDAVERYEFTEIESKNHGDNMRKESSGPFRTHISGSPFRVHVLKCKFPLSVERFFVKVPTILIDGATFDLGVIEFFKTSEWTVSPVNC